ncbi:MAG TPA: O-methyltransferase [Sphingomonadaceae bacterium]|nr:O-methyltransferase [Sphingomonadaceae bacterium]
MGGRIPDYPSGSIADWIAVDRYFAGLLTPGDPVLEQALGASAAAGLPSHEVSPLQGALLALLLRISGARRVLEIGTLGGYSTILLARALPEGGEVITLEADETAAGVAQANIGRAGLEHRVSVVVGQALDTLPLLSGPFDFIFIDADKQNNPHYLQWALALSRVGTIIVGDNVVRGGAVADGESADLRVQGVRAFLNMMAAEPRLEATAIQTVGEKGWDGFVLALVGPLDEMG